MRAETINIKVNNKEIELHIGDDIWFVTDEDYSDTVHGGIIEQFYNNSFKLHGENNYYNCNIIIDMGIN
jgi:hypothetical protein